MCIISFPFFYNLIATSTKHDIDLRTKLDEQSDYTILDARNNLVANEHGVQYFENNVIAWCSILESCVTCIKQK